jgi:hypothetical protein
MAREITCVARHPLHPSHLEQVGGRGWSGDIPTVVGQIEEGREYYVQQGAVLLRVCVISRHGRPALGTDPAESAEDALLALPDSDG